MGRRTSYLVGKACTPHQVLVSARAVWFGLVAAVLAPPTYMNSVLPPIRIEAINHAIPFGFANLWFGEGAKASIHLLSQTTPAAAAVADCFGLLVAYLCDAHVFVLPISKVNGQHEAPK